MSVCGGETEGVGCGGLVGRKGPEQQCQSTGMTGCLRGADGGRSLNARLRRSRFRKVLERWEWVRGKERETGIGGRIEFPLLRGYST